MKIVLQIYKEAKKYWGFIAISVVATLIITAMNLLTPRLTQNMIAILENNTETDKVAAIVKIAIILLIAFAIRATFQFLSSYISHYAAWHFVADIRTKVYAHLQKLSMKYYHNKQTGQLMSRVVNDTANFEMLIAHAIPDLVTSILLFVGVTIILFLTNPFLAMLTCIPIPFILLTRPAFMKIRQQHRNAQIYIAELNASLQDNFSGIKEIQVFNRQDDELGRISKHSKNYAMAQLKALFYSAIMNPTIGFCTSMGTVIVVGVGGYLALKGSLTVAEIVGFLLYLGQFYGPVSTFTRIIEDMQAGIAGGERVFEILNTEPDIKDKPGAIDVGILKGVVSFNHVSFDYDCETKVLNDITFEMPAGSMYALVGATGVGKTTLAALIARFYDPDEGSITIDGIDIKDMTLFSLRNQMSIVLQDVFLFNGTIGENISYGRPEASMQEIEEASRIARIHDYISSLPMGYETLVGERGMRLSGGQKQRISIARSILADSPILILDEATSAVDTETEKEIQDAIEQIAGTRTLIVIAHRLSTVKRADCILVLEDGKIVEKGSHDDLIKLGGLYSHLYLI